MAEVTADLAKPAETPTEEADLPAVAVPVPVASDIMSESAVQSSLLFNAATLVQHLATQALTLGVITCIWPALLVILVLTFLVLPVGTEIHGRCSQAWTGGQRKPIQGPVKDKSLARGKPEAFMCRPYSTVLFGELTKHCRICKHTHSFTVEYGLHMKASGLPQAEDLSLTRPRG
jgi:hypothetical protein